MQLSVTLSSTTLLCILGIYHYFKELFSGNRPVIYRGSNVILSFFSGHAYHTLVWWRCVLTPFVKKKRTKKKTNQNKKTKTKKNKKKTKKNKKKKQTRNPGSPGRKTEEIKMTANTGQNSFDISFTRYDQFR